MDTPATVLVADDSRTEAVRFRWVLEHAAYQPIIASNGHEALSLIRQSPPDVIVTDLNMPEMNGLELVEAVRAEFPLIPIVLATAVGSEEIAAEALAKGAASYVPKRFLEELIPTLQRLLRIAKAARTDSLLDPHATFCEVRFTLTSDEMLIAPLAVQLKWMFERFGLCDGNTALRAAAAVDEALQNAIEHGNFEVSSSLREIDEGAAYRELLRTRNQQAPYKDRRVHVRACVTRDAAEIGIRDEGPGFDHKSISHPTDPKYFDQSCGRGMWLIHALMDEVRFNDCGNEITMILRKKKS